MDSTLIIILAAVAVALLWLILNYNRLVRLRNRIEAAWSQIDVQLKRRYDLIPNLVEKVKGYAAHESETLEAVVAARQFYNEQVLKYDNSIESFPTNMIAGMFNFEAKDYFEMEEAAREPVRVDFGTAASADDGGG